MEVKPKQSGLTDIGPLKRNCLDKQDGLGHCYRQCGAFLLFILAVLSPSHTVPSRGTPGRANTHVQAGIDALQLLFR
jgi:hypothetical protein